MRKNLIPRVPFLFTVLTFVTASTTRLNATQDSIIAAPSAPANDLKTRKAREYFEKGNAYAERGLTDQAGEFWKMAHDLDPSLTEATEKLATLPPTSSPKSPGSIENPTSNSGGLKQQRFSDLLNNAQEAYQRKNYAETLKYLDLTDSLSPNSPLVKNLRALTDLENFQSDPDRPYNHLVKTFFEDAVENYRHKHYEEALQSLGEAQNLDHDHPLVLRLKEQIQSENADSLLTKEIQRAQDQWKASNDEIALEILENVLKKHPRFQPALELQAKIQDSSQSEQKSKITPLLDRAKTDEKYNRFVRAKNAYERVLKIEPSNQVAKEGIERMSGLIDPLQAKIKDLESAIQANRKDRAEGDFQEVRELAPNHPKLHDWAGQIAEISTHKNSEDAQAGADEAYNLGLESYRKGDLAGAKKFWSETIRLNPQYVQARRNLDRLIEENPQLK